MTVRYAGRYTVTRLDVTELRNYAGRDWGMPERLARKRRARLPVEEKVRLAIDLATHQCIRALLDRASHVRRR